MPSPPHSLDEAVNRIARALADDDGSGWWGEEGCGPGHVDAARRLAEAADVAALLQRARTAEGQVRRMTKDRQVLWRRAESAEARVASLERENARLREAVEDLDLSDDYTFEQAAPGELVSCTRPIEDWKRLRKALAQGAAAPLPGDTE